VHGARVVVVAVLALAAGAAAHAPIGALSSVPLAVALLAQAALLTLATVLEHARARALGLHLAGPAVVAAAALALALVELGDLDETLASVALVDADVLFFIGARGSLEPMVVGLAGAGLGLGVAALSGAYAAVTRGDDRGGRGFGGGLLVLFAGCAGAVVVAGARAAVELRRAYAFVGAGAEPGDVALAYALAEGALALAPLGMIGALVVGAGLLAWRSRQARFFRGPRLAGLLLGVLAAGVIAAAPPLWWAAEARVHARHVDRLALLEAPSAPTIPRVELPVADAARASSAEGLPDKGRVDLALAAHAPAAKLLTLAREAQRRGLSTNLVARTPSPPPRRPARLGYPSAPRPAVALPLLTSLEPAAFVLGAGAIARVGEAPSSLEEAELPAGSIVVTLHESARVEDVAVLIARAAASKRRVLITAVAEADPPKASREGPPEDPRSSAGR
jgi:hypothetical protein